MSPALQGGCLTTGPSGKLLPGRSLTTILCSLSMCQVVSLALWISVQFSSVAQSCLTLCDPMNRSTPGLPVHHQLPESTETHVHQVDDAIQPSHPLIPFSSCPQSFPASGSFPMSQLFASGGQSVGVSASTSVLPITPRTDLL